MTRQMTDPSLATLRCGCGSESIFALRPGVDPERRGAVDLFTRLDPLVSIGAPDVAWCAACWSKAFSGERVGVGA